MCFSFYINKSKMDTLRHFKYLSNHFHISDFNFNMFTKLLLGMYQNKIYMKLL